MINLFKKQNYVKFKKQINTLLFLLIIFSSNFTSSNDASAILSGTPDYQSSRHAIYILTDDAKLCTGIIVKKNIILTAAQCVTSSRDYRVGYRDQDNKSVLIAPKQIIVHPEFVPDAVRKKVKSIDLAAIVLSSPLANWFTPVKIDPYFKPQSGDNLIIEGFGQDIEGNSKSLGTYRQALVSVVEPYGKSSVLVSVSDPNVDYGSTGQGACFGDSGGGIFSSGGLIGIIAWTVGEQGRACGVLTQGALLSSQINWINNIIEGKYPPNENIVNNPKIGIETACQKFPNLCN